MLQLGAIYIIFKSGTSESNDILIELREDVLQTPHLLFNSACIFPISIILGNISIRLLC